MFDYQTLTDDELLHLAQGAEELTDEARVVLDAELSRRKLTASDIALHLMQCDQWEKEDERRRAVRSYISHVGLGKKFLGRANRRRDPGAPFELCESTLWFVVLWFPVFPIATYTVRRNLEQWWGGVSASNEIPLERLPRDWEQILLTWTKAFFVLWVIVLVVRHPEWLGYFLKRLPRTS